MLYIRIVFQYTRSRKQPCGAGRVSMLQLLPMYRREQRRTVDIARPRYLAGDRRNGALLIHGYASYSGMMDPLARRLNERGFTVSVPRLPGHGTDADDFVHTGWKEWRRAVYDAYFDLRSCCDEVYVCGLSLGGILTLCLAADFAPERIALLAPAVVNTEKLIYLTPLVRYFVRSLASTWDPQGQDMDDPDIMYIAEEYWSRSWPRPASQVLAAQRYARRRLDSVEADTLIVLSKEDTTVPLSAGRIIERSIRSAKVHSVILVESKHNLLSHVEAERVTDLVDEWFST